MRSTIGDACSSNNRPTRQVTVKDVELEKTAQEFGEQVNREIEWLCAQIKVISPQALTVPPNLAQGSLASRPKYPTPAAIPDQIWAPLMGGLLTLVVSELATGFVCVFLFNAYNDPVTLQTKELTAGRLGAAVAAIVLTLLLTLLFKANHPPAGATTLLTALGSIKTTQDALNLAIGVLIIAVVGELIRKTRTSTLTQMTVEPSIPAKDGKL